MPARTEQELDWYLKGRSETDTVHGVLGSGEGAWELTAATTAIRGIWESGERAGKNAAAHGVLPSSESGPISTRGRMSVPKSFQTIRRVASSVIAGAAVSYPLKSRARCAWWFPWASTLRRLLSCQLYQQQSGCGVSSQTMHSILRNIAPAYPAGQQLRRVPFLVPDCLMSPWSDKVDEKRRLGLPLAVSSGGGYRRGTGTQK